MEKDLVLDVSKRLGALIEKGLGSQVIYTRTDDSFVPLEARTAMANRLKADLFLSIHANSSPLRSVSGSETYYLSFTTSRTALDVAARENASSERSVFELRELLQKIALKDKVDESREFAGKVQAAMQSVNPRATRTQDRGIKKAPFVVLIGASMPSILTEIGFVSNAREEGLMKQSEYRQKIAEALYKGVSQYAQALSHFDLARREDE
jgi:N-acetylmuramoyl-L-alanine amidase